MPFSVNSKCRWKHASQSSFDFEIEFQVAGGAPIVCAYNSNWKDKTQKTQFTVNKPHFGG